MADVQRITTNWFFGQDGILYPAGSVVTIDDDLLEEKGSGRNKRVPGLATAKEIENDFDTQVPGSGAVKTARAAKTVRDTTKPASQPAVPIVQAIEEALDSEELEVQEGGKSRKADPLA